MNKIRFHFSDRGQDCLWWDVEDLGDGTGRVMDAGPFQANVWADGNYYVNLMYPHGVGDRLLFTNDLPRSLQDGFHMTHRYRVDRVEHLSEMAGAA
ncbi:hypothetical protein [Ochrobactrum sp. BTU2]|uniref:hypothetical protein n=1 Tax=Ochrobactrum sp. BTU2 TaxID=2856166 RepID=UPI00211A5B4B|nr:hypothetical protein [Ochrobactrum sp. BTU2]MCQ9145871.1 hypothetical protein [Ochrobactrum sp. BTU2]